MTKYTDEEYREAIESSDSYSKAAAKLGIHINTVIHRARILDIRKPNTGGKRKQYDLQDILNGKHPQYPTYKLKNRLLEAGLFEHQCSICGISEWMGKPIVIELDHIDGTKNHSLTNLRMLCPNCHSQTDTYKSKNIGRLAELG